MPKLSQYELERQANIARNRSLMEVLEVNRISSAIGIAKAKRTAKPRQLAKRKQKEKAPRRRSVRLKNVVFAFFKTPTGKKKRENPEDISRLKLTFKTIVRRPHISRVNDRDTQYNNYKRYGREVKDLRKRLRSMKVISQAKVNQNRIYSCAYHPDISKDLIFFGDKYGELGIWDATAPTDEITDEDGIPEVDNRQQGKYWRLQLHRSATSPSSISSIKFNPVNARSVYTISYDGTIRNFCFVTQITREIYASEDGVLITHADLTPSGHEMWISDGTGRATHLDLREKKSKARRFGLSDNKIGCISINPSYPNLILTASDNCTLKIWDVRKLQTLAAQLSDSESARPRRRRAEEPTLVEYDYDTVTDFNKSKKSLGLLRGEWLHDKSCSSAYWDPRGGQIVSTSLDDTVRLWSVDSSALNDSNPFKSFKPFNRIHHDCWTRAQRSWVTTLRAQWSPNPDVYPHFTIGNRSHSLDIFSCKGDLLARLSDPSQVTAIQAVTCSHPKIVERAASGNGRGHCVLWAPLHDS